MNFWKNTLTGLLSAAATLLVSCQTSDKLEAPVALTWEMTAANIEPGYYENAFTLKNVSQKPLDATGWALYYSQLPRGIKQVEEAPAVRVEDVNGNFFRLVPTDGFAPLAPGDSLRVVFRCSYQVKRDSDVPEGTYWVGADGRPLSVGLTVRPLPGRESLRNYPDATRIYERNQLIARDVVLAQSDILPSVKKAVPGEGELRLDGKVALSYPDAFAGEAGLLQEKLKELYGLEVAADAPVSIVLEPLSNPSEAVNEEYYTLYINKEGVRIAAATPHGIFNGTQTLLALLKGAGTPCSLQAVAITDYPDLLYRGQMIDVARDFTKPEDMKRLVDLLASYKMNALHFHCVDDEGWRLEIPGLEELTEVGSRRGHTTDESQCLYPGYDGGYDPDAPTPGNGYYSREEFIDLLRYAARRHVRVIPEIETPGHARAAIVSMKARYNRYIGTDPEKATEYLLSEPEDTSRYVSVQSYTDNVINVALPSTYRFLRKVVSEISDMYREAGVECTTIHMGGDEVAHGAWMGSPACRKLMADNGWSTSHDLAEYFISQVALLLKEQNIRLSGWQEVAVGHNEETHRIVWPQTAGAYCWNTNGPNAEVVYSTANNGYPVVLCNVGNFYMDMAYDGHPGERGLDWGGYVDEAVSFSMLPFDIYRSIRFDGKGSLLDTTGASKGKTPLTPEGRKNIVGVQGQLFAETIRNFGNVQYYLFPKIMGLAERGWEAHPAWETLSGAREEEAFLRALSAYYEKIGTREMPFWAKLGVTFRLPHPGLLLKDGLLYANDAYRNAEIRYTTDGTEPTEQSALWTGPVSCSVPVVKAKAFYQGRESLTIQLKNETK